MMTSPNNPNLNDPNRAVDPNDPVDVERTGYRQTIAILVVIILAIFVVISFGYYMYATNYPAPLAVVPQPPAVQRAITTTPSTTATQSSPNTQTTTTHETSTTVTTTPAPTAP